MLGHMPRLRGLGRHVKPSIDDSGLTAEDFDDPGFEEDYMSGAYDVQCGTCKGKRVVPIADESDTAGAAFYDKYLDAEYSYARECAQERAMGA